MRVLWSRRWVRRVFAVICALFALVVFLVGPLARTAGAPAFADTAAPLADPPAAGRASLADRREAPPPPPPRPAERQTLAGDRGTPVHAYPPIPTGPGAPDASRDDRRPLVVMLHGMCGEALPTCDFWSRAGREGSWLVCPTGNGICGGAPDWKGPGEEKAASIDASVAAVERAYGPYIDHRKGDILAGFSRGAFVARDVIYARPGSYAGAVLVGAALSPDPSRFKASGIRRVVLAAGEYDGARPAMQRAARALSAGGVPARFITLGRIGHWLPDDFEDRMREALRWVREG